MRSIQEAQVKGKKVFVRVDYNVPIKSGQVIDNERIIASLDTINFLLENGASLILCSHLGRPEGRPNVLFSLQPVAQELEKLINKSVQFSEGSIGKARDQKVADLKENEILLLENVRFHSEEEENNPAFARDLSRGCDIYVNDAFSASHRAHASIVGVPILIDAYAGIFLEKEIENLSKILNPKRPFTLILGGAKMSDKIGLLKNLIGKLDTIILGGAVANTFLVTKEYKVGNSIVEPESLELTKSILKEASEKNVRVLLPSDVVVANSVNSASGIEKPANSILDNEMILDIGSGTVSEFAASMEFASTIFWNGPLGYTENSFFSRGTKEVALAVANSDAFSVVGGGDTIASLDKDLKSKFGYVSMAGGASLEFLSGKELPGIKALG